LVPDVVTYNSILYAYFRDDDKNANGIERILSIVDFMNENKVEQPLICPDCFTYHCVLKAWKKSNNLAAAQHAVRALEKMHELWEQGDTSLIPSTMYYNMAINEIAKDKNKVDGKKALEVFDLLQSSRFVDPDIISYTSVIESLSKSDDPLAAERSLELFNEVSQLFSMKEDPELMPNLRTYTMAILSLTKNPTISNVVQARNLLTQLEERYGETKDTKLRPNAYPYNYVLNCAASCIGDAGDKLKAFQIATQTYNDLRKSEHVIPDSYTYSFWIKCSNNLLPIGELRTKCISLSFNQCKKDGLVNEAVLRRLLAGTPLELLGSLLKIDGKNSSVNYRRLTLEDLPLSWSRNVR
jgi:hypothetical protein